MMMLIALFILVLGLIVLLYLLISNNDKLSILTKLAFTESGLFLHVVGYFTIGATTRYSFNKNRFWHYLVGLLMLGIVLEIIQLSIPTRFNNLYDLVGNTTGITIGIIAIGVFVSFMERKKAR